MAPHPIWAHLRKIVGAPNTGSKQPPGMLVANVNMLTASL